MEGNRRRTARELEQLYNEHAAAMFQHGMALLRNEAAVRDLLQDVFLKLAEGRGPARGIENEKAYLLRMIHHGALNLKRHAQVRRKHAEKSRDDEVFAAIPNDSDRETFRQQLEAALRRLPDEQREVAVLRLWQERTFEEIAVICGISANTAASRYRYALDKLRNTLRPLYEDL